MPKSMKVPGNDRVVGFANYEPTVVRIVLNYLEEQDRFGLIFKARDDPIFFVKAYRFAKILE